MKKFWVTRPFGWRARPAIALACLLFTNFAFAQHYVQNNLVADVSGNATNTDANLVNPWGLARSASSFWWAANNGSGTSTLYDAAGTAQALVVTIPPPKGSTAPATPTGAVFNGTSDFALAPMKPALFLFATEDGTISGWNPGVSLNSAQLVVDKSKKHAIYKGITISEFHGAHYLYVTNFHEGRVEVYDTYFHRVKLSEKAFEDYRIPHGYAPFNIQAVGKNIFVTYAKQDEDKEDDAPGPGFGFVDVYGPTGKLRARLEHGPWLNAPWAVAMAPSEFGEFSHSLLIGNFGSGQIAAYNPVTGRFRGLMKNPDGSTLSIDGLWALGFGNNANAGPETTLFFSAGPNDEADGLFGTLTPVTAELNEEDEP
ncbi:MAG TPA: TIGR03118 family protein [Terriglobales bacterium]|nr:TIGR03118 family protein [Terriglobales bacterium]